MGRKGRTDGPSLRFVCCGVANLMDCVCVKQPTGSKFVASFFFVTSHVLVEAYLTKMRGGG